MKRFNFFNGMSGLMLTAFAALLLINGCKKDDDMNPTTSDPVASFQFEVKSDNFLAVVFTNFSQNADTYTWDFGDGNTSTEKDPEHAFSAAGTYNVTLTVTGANSKTATRTETITLSDPDAILTLLAGADSKTWYLQREGIALGIGPVIGDNQWWSFGGVTPLGDRPCILDDKYIFHRNGTFEFQSNGTIFIDSKANGGWLGDGVDEGCYDETEPGVFTAETGEDLSAFGDGGNYTYEYDQANGTLTLNGEGAYIGLANKTETGDNYIPQSTKTYMVFNLAEGSIADTLQIAIQQTGAVWNFYLVSYKNEADLPEIPSTMPRANFDFTKNATEVTFNNLSANATSYMWDFGDGAMSTEKDPVHNYAGDGDYEVTLTASDANGASATSTKTVTISTATFTTAVWSNATGKVWKLAGEASFKVGPAPGSGEWWGGLDAQGVMDRACQMDDEFIFYDNGEFVYDAKGQIFAEDYIGGANTCVDEADVMAPYDVLTSGMHMFTTTDENGNDPSTITANGDGAFIGFSKAFNGGELNTMTAPKSSITYNVFDYTNTPDKETVTLVIDIAGDGSAWWTITLESLK
ncbi:MAG: PKD domain-containing protein [Saprospiraceae bacterium]|nr:PKD domain-containing protein [Saprospiraceae bacterium]